MNDDSSKTNSTFFSAGEGDSDSGHFGHCVKIKLMYVNRIMMICQFISY